MKRRVERPDISFVQLNPSPPYFFFFTQASMNKYTSLPWQVFFASIVAIAVALHYGLCTQDDAFISFRYAENLVRGNGLVFNIGERVEGFSNPSWTLLLALAIKIGMDPVIASLLMGYFSIIFLIYATAHLSRQVGGVVGIACFLVAIDPSMLLESVQGLESVFYAGLITLACSRLLEEREANKSSMISTSLFAIACCTRPEAPLFFILAHGSLGYKDRRWSKTLSSAIPIVGLLLVITILRLFYYQDVLPNTFYAKVGGVAISRGLEYCHFHFRHHPIFWIALIFVWTKHGQEKKWFMLTTVLFIYLFYVVWIGGDFKPTSRFILPVSGIMAVAVSTMVQRIIELKQAWIWFFLSVIMFLGRASLFTKAEVWAADRRQNFVARKFLGEWLKANTSRSDVLAMHSIGAIPYYAERKTIDMWGLTNKTIAKTPSETFGEGMAGHEKTNPEYVFSRSPEIYLPEDKFFLPQKITQTPEPGFPKDFALHYQPISIRLEGSWLNIWIKKGYQFSYTKDKVKDY